jgi:hypothetical protein
MKRKVTIDAKALNFEQDKLFSGKVVVDKDASFQEVAEEVRKQCHPSVDDTQALRVLQISFHKVHKIFKPEESVSLISSRASPEVLVEFVAPEEGELEKGDRLMPCVHTEYDHFLSPFGTPFLFVFKKKEKVAAIRARLALRLDISEEEMEKWKFGIAEGGFSTGLKSLDDDDHVDASRWTANSYFAMIHPNNRRSYRYARHGAGGVVIKGVPESDK